MQAVNEIPVGFMFLGIPTRYLVQVLLSDQNALISRSIGAVVPDFVLKPDLPTLDLIISSMALNFGDSYGLGLCKMLWSPPKTN